MKLSSLGILRTADYFSIDLLLKTLFNPFRQISAAEVDGPLPMKMQAFFDRLFSRAVGTVVRTIFIFIGLAAIILRCIWVLFSVLVWTILPLTPILGIAFWQMRLAL